jgi:hypothetical protein
LASIGSFLASGEADGELDGDEGAVEPEPEPDGGGVVLEGEEEEDGGVLEVAPDFFEASSPQAPRASAAAAAISRALVIPVPLRVGVQSLGAPR